MQDLIGAYDGRTVAVTGASGYLASVLIDELKVIRVSIVRVSRRDLPPSAGVKSLQADVRSKDSWAEIVAKADVIFHLAGSTSVYSASRDPIGSLSSTLLPIIHLVNAARESGRRPRVIFASTATVYGLTDRLPVTERTMPKPITNYDLHKLFAEKELEMASKRGLLDSVSLRLSNVYGPSSSTSSAKDRGILNKAAKLALQGAKLQVYGDGGYLRDYVYVDDVARAFLAAAVGNQARGRSFNVGSGKGVTVREVFALLGQRVETITGKRVDIESVPWPEGADPIEFRNFAADISSFHNSVGWRPIIGLREGIDRMISGFANAL